MFVPEIAQFVGRFCEVATLNGRHFGEVVRLSTALFLVRPSRSASSRECVVDARDITAIRPLASPHF